VKESQAFVRICYLMPLGLLVAFSWHQSHQSHQQQQQQQQQDDTL